MIYRSHRHVELLDSVSFRELVSAFVRVSVITEPARQQTVTGTFSCGRAGADLGEFIQPRLIIWVTFCFRVDHSVCSKFQLRVLLCFEVAQTLPRMIRIEQTIQRTTKNTVLLAHRKMDTERKSFC